MRNQLIVWVALFTSFATFSQKQWTLKECVDEALRKNISIEQSKLNLSSSEKEVDIAKGNFLPNLNASTGGNLNFGTGFDPVSQDRVNTSFFGGSINLSSGITIFNGYRNTYVYKQAQLGVESSKLDLRQIENDISLRVVNGYLNVLFAKENLNVAKIQYQISENQIVAAESRFKSGVIPKGDLLNTQSTAASNLQSVIAQENALDLALLTLAQLLQLPAEGFDVAPVDVGTPSSNLFYTNSDSVYEKSLDNLPEIERAKLAIENAGLSLKISESSFLPSITASAGLSTNYGYNLNLPPGFSNTDFFDQIDDNLGYGLGFNVSIPIFNRFQTQNRVAQAKINKDLSETRLATEKLNLKQTIEQSFLDVKTALKAYEASKISLQAQEEAFKNAQEMYNFGAMTQFDFDQVRNRVVSAEATLIRSKYDYVFKTKVLQFYAGELVFE